MFYLLLHFKRIVILKSTFRKFMVITLPLLNTLNSETLKKVDVSPAFFLYLSCYKRGLGWNSVRLNRLSIGKMFFHNLNNLWNILLYKQYGSKQYGSSKNESGTRTLFCIKSLAIFSWSLFRYFFARM